MVQFITTKATWFLSFLFLVSASLTAQSTTIQFGDAKKNGTFEVRVQLTDENGNILHKVDVSISVSAGTSAQSKATLFNSELTSQLSALPQHAREQISHGVIGSAVTVSPNGSGAGDIDSSRSQKMEDTSGEKDTIKNFSGGPILRQPSGNADPKHVPGVVLRLFGTPSGISSIPNSPAYVDFELEERYAARVVVQQNDSIANIFRQVKGLMETHGLQPVLLKQGTELFIPNPKGHLFSSYSTEANDRDLGIGWEEVNDHLQF